MTVICIDTEYDARYCDSGVGRLACMTYSFGPDHAAIAGPEKAVDLWLEWVNDKSVTFLTHAGWNDHGVLAHEAYRRTTGRECAVGQDWAWELAHRVYDPIYSPKYPGDDFRARCRSIDTETRQRLTNIRFGPHKADVGLGSIAQALFGIDKSDTKKVPDDVKALLRAAVPYDDWPADVLARAPHRVLFGMYLERYGEDPSRWPPDAVAYALDDAQLPWRVYEWQCKRWGSQRIPDDTRQIMSAWALHVLSLPGWKTDAERARQIRAKYEAVIANCDRTLIDAGILDVPGAVETAKRKSLQTLIYDAFAGDPPLSKSHKNAPPPTDEAERRDATATDAKTVTQAIEQLGGTVVKLQPTIRKPRSRKPPPREIVIDAPEATHHDGGLPAAVARALESSGAPILAAHLLRAEAQSLATRVLAEAGLTEDQADAAPPEYARAIAVVDACTPVLVAAGLIEVSHPRTIKKRQVADRVYAILGEDAPLSKTKAEEIPNPTPEQRREFCSTAAKTVREAIIVTGGKLRLPADAVAKADEGEAAFDDWLGESKQPALNAFALRSKAGKVISSFLTYLDTGQRVRTTYQTLVDTGRTSSRQPNVQQLPRDYDKPAHLHVRGCLVPDPGWAFLVADYSQLELCSLAQVLNNLVRFYAADPKRKAYAEHVLGFAIDTQYECSLARAINGGRDCHVYMASVLRGETYDETAKHYAWADAKKSQEYYKALGVSKHATQDEIEAAYAARVQEGKGEKCARAYAVLSSPQLRARYDAPMSADELQVIEDRQLSKPADFGFPGGLGVRKFIDYAAGYGMTIELPTAQRAKVAFMHAWPEMKLYFDHIGRMTADGVATVKQLTSKRERGDCFFTQACNTYFQGLAADGAKEALRRIIRAAYRVPSSPLYGTHPSGFVHDEFLVNCRIEQAERALPALEHEMIEGMRKWIPDVKIKAPGKVLTERWGK